MPRVTSHCRKGHRLTKRNLRIVPPNANRPSGQRKCRICDNARSARTRTKNRLKLARRQRERRQTLKAEVLAHYGKRGKLQCSWRRCRIVDIDMLSLDHVNDNGAEHRRTMRGWGRDLYAFVKRENYPPGFQTLCMNHQLKKELVRKRVLHIGN